MICLGYDEREKYEGNQSKCNEKQKHIHEVQGSVKIAGEDPHSHRFATVTGEAIPYGTNDHIHEVCFRSDFYDDHYHEFKGKTGCAIKVDEDRHVHYIESVTSVDDGHRHGFEAATLIENPTEKERKHRKEDYRNEGFRNENYRNTGYNRNRYR